MPVPGAVDQALVVERPVRDQPHRQATGNDRHSRDRCRAATGEARQQQGRTRPSTAPATGEVSQGRHQRQGGEQRGAADASGLVVGKLHGGVGRRELSVRFDGQREATTERDRETGADVEQRRPGVAAQPAVRRASQAPFPRPARARRRRRRRRRGARCGPDGRPRAARRDRSCCRRSRCPPELSRPAACRDPRG